MTPGEHLAEAERLLRRVADYEESLPMGAVRSEISEAHVARITAEANAHATVALVMTTDWYKRHRDLEVERILRRKGRGERPGSGDG